MTGEVKHLVVRGDAGNEAEHAGQQERHSDDECGYLGGRPAVARRRFRLLCCHRYAFLVRVAGVARLGRSATIRPRLFVDGSGPARVSAVTEQTLVLIKPDGVQRGLIGEILSRIEGKGLTIAALELKNVSDDLARKHYAEHEGKPFFGSLLEFITSGPVVAAIVEGPRAVAAFRQIAGATDPVEKAAPGTIRGDLALITQDNLVHGSDSPESAAREIELWFPSH